MEKIKETALDKNELTRKKLKAQEGYKKKENMVIKGKLFQKAKKIQHVDSSTIK